MSPGLAPRPKGQWGLHFTALIMESASEPRQTSELSLLRVWPLGIL